MAPVVSASTRAPAIGDPFATAANSVSGSVGGGSSFGGVAVLDRLDDATAAPRPNVMPPWVVAITVILLMAVAAGYLFTG